MSRVVIMVAMLLFEFELAESKAKPKLARPPPSKPPFTMPEMDYEQICRL